MNEPKRMKANPHPCDTFPNCNHTYEHNLSALCISLGCQPIEEEAPARRKAPKPVAQEAPSPMNCQDCGFSSIYFDKMAEHTAQLGHQFVFSTEQERNLSPRYVQPVAQEAAGTPSRSDLVTRERDEGYAYTEIVSRSPRPADAQPFSAGADTQKPHDYHPEYVQAVERIEQLERELAAWKKKWQEQSDETVKAEAELADAEKEIEYREAELKAAREEAAIEFHPFEALRGRTEDGIAELLYKESQVPVLQAEVERLQIIVNLQSTMLVKAEKERTRASDWERLEGIQRRAVGELRSEAEIHIQTSRELATYKDALRRRAKHEAIQDLLWKRISVDEVEGRADAIMQRWLTESQPQATKPAKYFWYCETCSVRVPSEHVTYEETHDLRVGGCGQFVFVREVGDRGEPAEQEQNKAGALAEGQSFISSSALPERSSILEMAKKTIELFERWKAIDANGDSNDAYFAEDDFMDFLFSEKPYGDNAVALAKFVLAKAANPEGGASDGKMV